MKKKEEAKENKCWMQNLWHAEHGTTPVLYYIEEMDPFLLYIVVLSYFSIDPFQGRSVTDDGGVHVTGSVLGNLSKEGFELSPSLSKKVRKEVFSIISVLCRPVNDGRAGPIVGPYGRAFRFLDPARVQPERA